MATKLAIVFALGGLLLLTLTSCVVNSPVPYQGDVANKDKPLTPIFDPEGASWTQPPVINPNTRPIPPQRQVERQVEPIVPEASNPEDRSGFDYYYLHTKDGTVLKRRPRSN